MMQQGNMTGKAIATHSRRTFDEVETEARLATLEQAARIIGDDSPWFALRVMTGREAFVQEALDVLGINSLVPMRKGKTWERRGRKIEGVMQPVIFGYVLVQSDPNPCVLVAFKGVQDVIGVLGGAEKPMRVRAIEINRFKTMADAGLYDWEKPSELVVKAGDKVSMTGGPFEAMTAIVITPNGKGKGDVVVTVDILGGAVPMTLPLAMLEKL
ncbi:transcription termination/antitermination protein NusG [Rhizobium halophytocola]|uniref:Transcriptional antiterminator NusG n=1 Tax=Rhizobium halophytocola TaxID=735519 RepID=A0ABS4DXV5_9HYPH|nr:transcription termination/antitermination NusG family protein [Rhizobium halophytocola]MBP1850523.1 transcriptional antiterminator NusG [Rhizobium halophytocola]